MTDNVIEFPNYNTGNIPEALRKLAKEVEDNPEAVEHIVLALASVNGIVRYRAFGKGLTKAFAVGLLEWAKLLIIGVK